MPPDHMDFAIKRLVSLLVPSDANEDDDEARERQKACCDLVKSILEAKYERAQLATRLPPPGKLG